MFKKKSDYIIRVADHMPTEELEKINFPVITVEVDIWSNITFEAKQ